MAIDARSAWEPSIEEIKRNAKINQSICIELDSCLIKTTKITIEEYIGLEQLQEFMRFGGEDSQAQLHVLTVEENQRQQTTNQRLVNAGESYEPM
jgi:hypothetical protein